jgi:hypothetical protein
MLRFRIIAVLTTLALAMPLAATALANGAEVDKHGTCTMGSRWELDAEDEGTNLEVDFEIDTTTAGQSWRIVLRHDGVVFFKQIRTTESDGEVGVERLVKDHSGSDRIAARGVNLKTDEVCRGSLSI